MAYSNWGAFVYRNGERQENKEDVPPFGDADVEAAPSGARIWVNLLKQREAGTIGTAKPWERCHHAVLGSERLRVCGYKSHPVLFLVGEDGAVRELSTYDFRQPSQQAVAEADWSFWESDGIAGEVEGYKFSAFPEQDPEAVELNLTEPDGTEWTSRCGYCIGAGHEDV